MFLGTTFLGGKYIFLPPATNIDNFASISISDGVYDNLFLSSDTTQTVDNLDDDWKYETKLNAKFDKDLEGGSVGFSTKNTDMIVIKTREKGTFDWKTIYTIPIEKDSDFNFVKVYPFSPNYSDNEYMLISQINGIENSYVITECKTEFDGLFIADKDNIYGTIFNITPTDITRNVNNTKLEMLNDKYPTVFTNSETNYISGNTSGCFLKVNADTCQVDVEGGMKYRKELLDWLTNNKTKILKLEDGKTYMIKVVGSPTDSYDGHQDLRRTSFEWVEVGDIDSEKDLYLNNLSDVTEEWW